MAATYRRCGALALAVLVMCCLSSVAPTASARDSPMLESGYEKIHFYLQEYFNVTFVTVVPPAPGHAFFGSMVVSDQQGTTTPDPASKVIAQMKSLGVGANLDETLGTAANLVSTIVFNQASGYGSDSTITFQGYYNLAVPRRVLSLTGGTGKFLLARGWVDTTTYFQDPAKGRFIRELTVHVYYGKL